MRIDASEYDKKETPAMFLPDEITLYFFAIMSLHRR